MAIIVFYYMLELCLYDFALDMIMVPIFFFFFLGLDIYNQGELNEE